MTSTRLFLSYCSSIFPPFTSMHFNPTLINAVSRDDEYFSLLTVTKCSETSQETSASPHIPTSSSKPCTHYSFVFTHAFLLSSITFWPHFNEGSFVFQQSITWHRPDPSLGTLTHLGHVQQANLKISSGIFSLVDFTIQFKTSIHNGL